MSAREWKPGDVPGPAVFSRMKDYLETEFDWLGMDADNTVECLRSAFEAAINTPKPDEPQGLGAVVEDADGRLFIRYRSDVAKCQWTSTDFGVAAKWDEIDAVKVLSPGWSE